MSSVPEVDDLSTAGCKWRAAELREIAQLSLMKLVTWMARIGDLPLMLHIGAVLLVLWLASAFHISSIWIFLLAFWFLYEVDKNYIHRTRRQLRSEERRCASQRRLLSDFEQAEWLNLVIKRIWPHFLEEFASQELLKDLVPWFLDKYKPWTVRKTTLKHLSLGRNAPTFAGIRVLERNSDDDHMVMEMYLDFLAADDMNAILSVQMRRRLGFGIWANIHISKLQIEGKVRVGFKFLKGWPFLCRVRFCFETPPYVQMTAKPVSSHGMNVTELPIVAGWMERMVADAFEQSLVEPNMLVIDVARILECMNISRTPVSSTPGEWFEVQERPPIAVAYIDILEAMDLKPSDMNASFPGYRDPPCAHVYLCATSPPQTGEISDGVCCAPSLSEYILRITCLADPYVKGAFATCKFKTKIHKKTLNPKWCEEFKVPIASWELPTLLVLHVLDKDQFRDDDLGFCELDLADYRGGEQHDMWLPLKDIKMGRLHVVVKVVETEFDSLKRGLDSASIQSNALREDDANVGGGEMSFMDDDFEGISFGSVEDGCVLIMRPGQHQQVSKRWQQRQGTPRRNQYVTEAEMVVNNKPTSSSSEDEEEEQEAKPRRRKLWRWHSPHSSKDDSEVLTVGEKGTTVRMKLADTANEPELSNEGKHSPPKADIAMVPESPSAKTHMKNFAKGMKYQAEKTAHNLGHALKGKGSSKHEKHEPLESPNA